MWVVGTRRACTHENFWSYWCHCCAESCLKDPAPTYSHWGHERPVLGKLPCCSRDSVQGRCHCTSEITTSQKAERGCFYASDNSYRKPAIKDTSCQTPPSHGGEARLARRGGVGGWAARAALGGLHCVMRFRAQIRVLCLHDPGPLEIVLCNCEFSIMVAAECMSLPETRRHR